MAIVTFDPAAFKAAYPEFASTPDARCQLMFDQAQYTLLDNVENAPPMDVTFRANLFNLIVAHLLLLLGTAPAPNPDGSVDSTPPGRISQATQGTVSTSFELKVTDQNASATWWNQTKYGAMFWAATVRFRSFRYVNSGNIGASGVGFAKAYGAPPFNVPGGV